MMLIAIRSFDPTGPVGPFRPFRVRRIFCQKNGHGPWTKAGVRAMIGDVLYERIHLIDIIR